MGIAVLPHYVAADAIATGQLQQIMSDHPLPDQEIHAVYPSPKLVPAKVTALIGLLPERLREEW
jgi:DNA-binding transcriptional LysR family regulator